MDNAAPTTAQLTDLSKPFPVSEVQWRAGATNRDKTKAQALAYVDPRVYEARLDDVMGGDWSVRFVPWGEQRIICELTVGSSTRSSTGEFDDSARVSHGPTAEAQAFKRACSKFGLGRYLYELPTPWVEYDEKRRKLVSTPQVPRKYHPGNPPGGRERPAAAPEAPEGAPIGPERAQRLLELLSAQYNLTEIEIQRLSPRENLADLTEEEGMTLLTTAESTVVPS